MKTRYFYLSLLILLFSLPVFAQPGIDSTRRRNDSLNTAEKKVDSLTKPVLDSIRKSKSSPRKASLRSAILPGWGQIYNKKYWKVPIVLGALGGTAYVFNFNLTQYKRVQYAYRLLITKDSANYGTVDADLQPFIKANASNDLRNYRNEYRKDIDYSVIVFLVFWGLNVVDATVDAHLKGFDVSDQLNVKLKPGFSPTSNTMGMSLVFDLHKPVPHLKSFR